MRIQRRIKIKIELTDEEAKIVIGALAIELHTYNEVLSFLYEKDRPQFARTVLKTKQIEALIEKFNGEKQCLLLRPEE